ncbi:triphosphoribosyl-dephospho-CoA synthase MdcB [Variovorax sp. J22P168]|uniref:triphosphoribosyl-dephospho-CoA synthase MdcB n=1 Tax=Variovorax jilinensis TaxID=3053513 RepID=UPI002575E247|nr:triphosphoribosyl-dephospho-CoA synthase MdcB [Variovorax sp. J22P168]MDM0015226.1 triphosphoribosyl-dephospho-CoA synthase MdcB [Variovorax sp. J22P168]
MRPDATRRLAPVPPATATPAPVFAAEAIAASAVRCLLLEVATWPKPGLVSHMDSGSHDDMDAETFRRSALAISPYFEALVDAGARGGAMGWLRVIGLEAEAAMLRATSGINTHRGAIFGLGLLCAAAGARGSGHVDGSSTLGAVVTRLWGPAILSGPVLLHSHGTSMRHRYGAGGARVEAALGFPTVYQLGLPVLRRRLREAPEDAEAARVEVCFELIAALEDTNLLHRGGPVGLRFARRCARAFLDQGGVRSLGWRDRAREIHQRFVARHLSPGGSADLLAMTLFIDDHEGELPA